MPNIASSKKRMRQGEHRRTQNRQDRSALRSAMKKVRNAGSRQEGEAAFKIAERLLDRAVRKSLVAKNTAARNKHRLAKVVAAL